VEEAAKKKAVEDARKKQEPEQEVIAKPGLLLSQGARADGHYVPGPRGSN
jgi:hypothetical protein